jgi:hypothetical protein
MKKDLKPFYSKNQDGKISLSNYDFKLFLEHYQYFKSKPNESSTFNLIKKNGIFLEIKDETDIKDFVLNYIDENDLGVEVFNLMSGRTSIFKRDFLSMIKTEKINILKDTNDTAYLFYLNGVVEVTKNSKQLKSYDDYKMSIWHDQVIKRNYIDSDHHESEFREFVWKISGGFDKANIHNENDKANYKLAVDRYNAFQSAIGYLVHSYNSNATGKAIVLNDEMISDDPNGRSGKSLLSNAIGHLKKVTSLNGKNFSFQGDFPYQSVKTDCQVLVFDDVKRGFMFENLFSVITEGIDITYKGQDTIKLPIEDSPKILITTNYILKGSGGSHDARKFELELSAFFNANYTPVDHFGHYLFRDWDDEQWMMFDCYMIECLKKYLTHGLMSYQAISLPIKKLESEITKELFECIKTIEYDEWIDANSFYDLYKTYCSKSYMAKTKNAVTGSLKKYCEFFNLTYESVTSNNIKKFRFIQKKQEVKPTTESDIWDEIENKIGF